eukprot:15365589-Ditylum_brightwellii.AAC.3
MKYLSMRKNFVREWHCNGDLTAQHIDGKLSPSDMFTKEDKDGTHMVNNDPHWQTCTHVTPLPCFPSRLPSKPYLESLITKKTRISYGIEAYR